MKRILLWACLVLPLLATPAFAEPGWDSHQIIKISANLLKKEDFAALDKLAIDIKAKGYDIRQRYPELQAFYEGFRIKDSATDREWLDQQGRLDCWMRDNPDSQTAKIAMVHWFLDYGWKARGTEEADKVSREGFKLMEERLRQGSAILKNVHGSDDPEAYRLWSFLEAEPDLANRGAGKAAFNEGKGKFKEYYPLYASRAYFLLPMWFGKKGDFEQFVTNEANTFPSEKGDVLYARVIRFQARLYDDSFFQKFHLDYARIKRGLLISAQNPKTRIEDLSDLAFLAAIQGDKETARNLILDLGPSIWTKGSGSEQDFVRLRKACGADEPIQKAMDLERSGKLDEAEKMYTSFHPDPLTNPWLKPFYQREGPRAKLLPLMANDKQTYAQLLDIDVNTANPNTLFDVINIAPMAGDWEKAEAAARLFDQKRPWNITGKNVLWLCALHKGDQQEVEAIRKQILDMKTDRTAYQQAQAVIDGSKRWDEVRAIINPNDGFGIQAYVTIALHYASAKDAATLQKAIDEMVPLCENGDIRELLQSMSFGQFSRSMVSSPAPVR
ncbi:MAG: hypothetical protein ACFUZC_18970 [Chthoniobacteraceae bacterium]